MGKRKNDYDEDKIRKKIKKLEDKLKEKYDRDYSEVDLQTSVSVDKGVQEYQDYDDQNSVYLPPSEWIGETESQVSLQATQQACCQPTQCLSPQPGPSSAPTPPAPAPAPAPVPSMEEDLDERILNILGDAPKPAHNYGKKIHKDIASRWQDILAKGLSKEAKEKIVKEYLIPGNCDLLIPPILNPEAKAALPEALVRRDFSLLLKQKHIAAALAALAQVTEMLISKEQSTEKLLKPMSDASCLLCDSHYVETKTRRSFVISSINNNLKGALTDTPRDKYLFGENLTEKLKAAKTIQRSGDTLKDQNKTQFNRNSFNLRNSRVTNRVNSKALHPRTAGRPEAGQNRPQPRAPAGRMAPLPRRPRSPLPRPPPPPLPPPAHRGHQYTRR